MERSDGRQSQPSTRREPSLSGATALRNGARQITAGPGSVCPVCGGSGVLRTEGAGHRTCLDCVGKGTLPHLESPVLLGGTSGAGPAALISAPLPQVGARALSASTSGAR